MGRRTEWNALARRIQKKNFRSKVLSMLLVEVYGAAAEGLRKQRERKKDYRKFMQCGNWNCGGIKFIPFFCVCCSSLEYIGTSWIYNYTGLPVLRALAAIWPAGVVRPRSFRFVSVRGCVRELDFRRTKPNKTKEKKLMRVSWRIVFHNSNLQGKPIYVVN